MTPAALMQSLGAQLALPAWWTGLCSCCLWSQFLGISQPYRHYSHSPIRPAGLLLLPPPLYHTKMLYFEFFFRKWFCAQVWCFAVMKLFLVHLLFFLTYRRYWTDMDILYLRISGRSSRITSFARTFCKQASSELLYVVRYAAIFSTITARSGWKYKDAWRCQNHFWQWKIDATSAY